MWTRDKSLHTRGFSTPPPTWKSGPPNPPMVPMSERKRVSPSDGGDLFHVMHKVPVGDSPYVRAKQVQLIEKDPSKAISLFWAAINAGDRVDSALKDMAIVMKQLNRSEEAIEAIKSFRHLCPHDSQESLNNVLVELYKRAGRIEEEIEMLQSKLKHIDEGIAFGGRRTKTARSQGKKVQITVEQERSRILGNLAWAYLQQGNYKTAEEYYMKSLSLELDKNKQCNLAICLMHMNRLAEAKSLLQVVRASSGNKPMDESYAKSFERAIQMLTELEAKSVLRPIQLDENCCKEISRFPISPINRNSKQGNSLTNEGQHYVSGCMISRRWADGHEEETVSVNKWKKDCYFKNSCEGRSSFSSRMKENQGGIVGTETTPYSKTFFSPAPDIWNREVLFTQPRRSSRGFNDGHQTREIWGRGVGSSNKKLSFESCSRTENMRAHVVRSLNEDLLASTTGKSEVAFQNSVSSISSPISRDLRRRPQKDAAVRSVLQPISSGNWKCTSRADDGCFQLKDEAVVVSSSQNTVNGDWRRTSWENDGMKKSAEPLMVGEDAKALEISTDGGPNQSSDTTVLGSMEWRNAFVEDCFGENTSSKVDDVHQPIAENQKPAPDFSMYSKCKKSWADMVEEEEQELLNGRTEYFDSWYTEDGFNNENLNCNITPESPCLQSQMKSLGQKLQSTDLVDEYVSGNAASSRNSTVRRSLCFGQQQEQESVDYISSSPVPKEALNFEGSDSVQANGKGSIYGKNSSFSRRKRLQSFQDITEFQDSP